MIGVVIGRFQLDELHAGHLRLLHHVRDTHPNMLVLVGCRDVPLNTRDPLPFHVRAAMLREALPDAFVLPVYDMPTDELWSRQVDGIVAKTFPGHPAVLYGGRDSFIPHYKGRFKTQELTFPKRGEEPSATARRQEIADRRQDNPAFRAGMIYALSVIPPRPAMCTDVALVRNDHVLLARKPNEALWRFPGGHLDIREDLETCARRELREETGLEAGDFVFVTSEVVEDWRDRGIEDIAHVTALYRADYTFGAPTAADDIGELAWFKLDAISADQVLVEEHRSLFRKFVAFEKSRREVHDALKLMKDALQGDHVLHPDLTP